MKEFHEYLNESYWSDYKSDCGQQYICPDYRFDRMMQEVESIKQQLQAYKKAIEFSRQHYHLPQDVYDVFYKLQPEKVEFDHDEVLGEDE